MKNIFSIGGLFFVLCVITIGETISMDHKSDPNKRSENQKILINYGNEKGNSIFEEESVKAIKYLRDSFKNIDIEKTTPYKASLIFSKMIKDLGIIRNKIAIHSETKNADHFGRMRDEGENRKPSTPLYFNYKPIQNSVIEFIASKIKSNDFSDLIKNNINIPITKDVNLTIKTITESNFGKDINLDNIINKTICDIEILKKSGTLKQYGNKPDLLFQRYRSENNILSEMVENREGEQNYFDYYFLNIEFNGKDLFNEIDVIYTRSLVSFPLYFKDFERNHIDISATYSQINNHFHVGKIWHTLPENMYLIKDLIDNTFYQIIKIYSNNLELKSDSYLEHCFNLGFLMSHYMPYLRGSASVMEWFMEALLTSESNNSYRKFIKGLDATHLVPFKHGKVFTLENIKKEWIDEIVANKSM